MHLAPRCHHRFIAETGDSPLACFVERALAFERTVEGQERVVAPREVVEALR